MQSKILLITIFVAVHVNYICSLNLDIRVCKSDEDVLRNIEELKDETFPIYITDKYEENYLNNEGMDVLIPFYEKNQISHLLIVLADSCEATRNVLCGRYYNKIYPAIFNFKEGRLRRRRWEKLTDEELTASLENIRMYKPKFNAEFNLDNQIRLSIKEIKNKREIFEEMARNQKNRPVIPTNSTPPLRIMLPVSYRGARPPANQSFVLAQPDAAARAQYTGMTNQMPIMTRPRANVRPPYQQTDFAQTSMGNRSYSSQIRPPYWQTNFAQTMRNPSVGTSSTQPDTRERAVGSTSNFSAPMATWTSSSLSPVGVQTIRSETPRTLELFGKEPVTPQQNEIETLDLLDTVGRNQQEGQYYRFESDSTPMQYNQYNQLIEEKRPSKKLKSYKGFSGSRSSSSSST